ncbi:cyclase family protein [Flagellimonas allohymeniacidonis]|uniref:Cyclase family protein n=1 Tax=Flagellimonas allohymeniacidonis TaxID=2517819 RepID=A0A4Q8QF74_9FLAO|nr:cyclase family protein [Allomuricauda hymeniacidonis]TAI47173.1 cyclase family protein [Allomuricauda hymeniacidonis]
MIAAVKHGSKSYRIDFSKPIDISLPLIGGEKNVNAWYLKPPVIEPHSEKGFVGQVSQGGAVNFNDIQFNPHSHVTHTECLGHITEGFYSINKQLRSFFFWAELITVAPEESNGDFIISEKQLNYALGNHRPEALVIRTLPNVQSKKSMDYSNTNPPYLLETAMDFLVEHGIEHLLVDLPSVDRERDEGRLAGHKAFWGLEKDPRMNATITELIFVPNSIADGTYILNLQVAPFENDAAPSRPVLYKIEDP